MKFLSTFILMFSRKTALSLGRFLGCLAYYFFRQRRRLALENLVLSLGDVYSPSQRKEIIRRLFENLGANLIEILRFSEVNESNISDFVVFHGREVLDKIYAQKKGILGLSAHLGNWEFTTTALGLLGYQVAAVVKQLRQDSAQQFMLEHRKKHLTILSGKHIIKDVLKQLKLGSIVGIVLDQHGIRSESVQVPFFGRQAWTLKGLAVLAKRTGCPVLPIYTYRDEHDRHHIVVCPEIELSSEDTIETATLKYTQWLESVIRQHPEQWIWTHNRWKTN